MCNGVRFEIVMLRAYIDAHGLCSRLGFCVRSRVQCPNFCFNAKYARGNPCQHCRIGSVKSSPRRKKGFRNSGRNDVSIVFGGS